MSKKRTEGITEPQARTLNVICQLLDSTGLPPTVKELAEARASLGLDKPYYLQYLEWMKQIVTGNLGQSFWTKEPISALILRRGPCCSAYSTPPGPAAIHIVQGFCVSQAFCST